MTPVSWLSYHANGTRRSTTSRHREFDKYRYGHRVQYIKGPDTSNGQWTCTKELTDDEDDEEETSMSVLYMSFSIGPVACTPLAKGYLERGGRTD